nr:hypothetical protein [uncultured Prevotella sp.]
MRRNILYSLLIVIASLGFVACDSDDNEKQSQFPDGAKPSTEFTLGNNADEQYAKDAIKMDVKTWGDGKTDQEFSSIELFADGHFLITTPKAKKAQQQTVGVTRQADGSTAIFKKHGTERMKTRAVDAEGTIIIDNGLYIYGTYTRVKDGVYQLSNQTTIRIKDNGITGYATITYTNSYGVDITIVVDIDFQYKPDPAIRQLCRSWRMDSSETWLYANGVYFAYGKQWLNLGRVYQEVTLSPEGKQWDFDEDDILDDKDDYCYRTIFSPCGTFVCFYMDGDVEIGRWEWKDTNYGILRCWEPFEIGDYDDDDDDYADVTVRFDGKKMRIYQDYMDDEDDFQFRVLNVSEFSARY